MSDLISRESLKQRINLNYNSHQYIDTQSIKDIINTEPSVEDKTVETLEKIKKEIHSDIYQGSYFNKSGLERAVKIIDREISQLKGE